jgi:ATP-dependent protease ClpP protease subunit
MREYDLNGVIVSNDDSWFYDWCGLEYTCPSIVRSFLGEADGEDVQININSGGGDLYSGINIHDMIKEYKGNVEIHVRGIAASAASIIAMAGKCLMSPGSILMIHNASQQDYGNKRDKTKAAADLAVHDRGIAAVYAEKTGMELSEILHMMDKETYLDAQTALEQGFVDGILTANDESAPRMVAAISNGLLPRDVINELRQLKQKEKQKAKQPIGGVPVEQLKKRLSLLRR